MLAGLLLENSSSGYRAHRRPPIRTIHRYQITLDSRTNAFHCPLKGCLVSDFRNIAAIGTYCSVFTGRVSLTLYNRNFNYLREEEIEANRRL